MKKISTLIFWLLSLLPALSSAGLISTRSTAPTTCAVGDIWINPGAATNDRIYTCTATNTWTKNSGRPWVIQATAPSDLSLIWFDNDQVPGYLVLKLHNGTTWVEQAMGEGSGTTYTAGTGIDITGGVISSTVTGTLPLGTEGQGLQKGASAWEAVDLAPLAFTDNVSRNSSTGVVSVPVTATATSGSVVPLTSGGAYTALAGKQDALVSGTNIKTINSTSLLGGGNIDIAGGTGGYVSLSATPYSDVACTTGEYGYYGSIGYMCTGGFWTSKWTLTTHSNPSPVTYNLTITPSGFTGADKFTYNSTDYTTEHVISGLSADASFTVTPDTGREIACTGTGLTDNTGGNYTANTDSANVVATCTSSVSAVPQILGNENLYTSSAGDGNTSAVAYKILESPTSACTVTSISVGNKNIAGSTAKRFKASIYDYNGTSPTASLAVSSEMTTSAVVGEVKWSNGTITDGPNLTTTSVPVVVVEFIDNYGGVTEGTYGDALKTWVGRQTLTPYSWPTWSGTWASSNYPYSVYITCE